MLALCVSPAIAKKPDACVKKCYEESYKEQKALTAFTEAKCGAVNEGCNGYPMDDKEIKKAMRAWFSRNKKTSKAAREKYGDMNTWRAVSVRGRLRRHLRGYVASTRAYESA